MVYLEPNSSIWVDLTIARTDPLWTRDVGTSMLWLGQVFAAALAPWVTARVHEGPFLERDIGRVVCFGGLSPGEVVSDLPDGSVAKVVGISQRRGRDGARFQCVLYRRWDPLRWGRFITDSHVRAELDRLPVATLAGETSDLEAALVGALEATEGTSPGRKGGGSGP